MATWFKRIGSLALLCAAAVTLPTTRAVAESIQIAVLDNSAMGPLATAVLRQAYGRLDVQIETRVLPLRRGIQMADRGEIDGDLIHSLPAFKEWDNLIVIRVPVARAVFVAYARGPTCPVALTGADLSTSRIAYMRGTRAVEDVLPNRTLLATANNLDALRHLERGIAQYAVVGQLEGDALIAEHRLHHFCKVGEPIATAELFHSLNKRHAQLAARLGQVLQDMSDSGEIRRIWSREMAQARARMPPAAQ